MPKEVAEASQIFTRSTKITMRNTADVTGGKPIAVRLQSISDVSAINPLVAFYDIPVRKMCYSFVLSQTPFETNNIKMII
jgi:hypothetical protein